MCNGGVVWENAVCICLHSMFVFFFCMCLCQPESPYIIQQPHKALILSDLIIYHMAFSKVSAELKSGHRLDTVVEL